MKALLAVGLGLLPSVCGGCKRDPGLPSVLFITIDTLRADHCSLYGYPRPTTPRLEAAGREGVVLERAYAPMATTAPSHTTMFTGLLPRRHGVLRNGLLPDAGHDTLAERLTRLGYRTGAVVSSSVLARKMGFAQGFASFDDSFPARALATREEILATGKPTGFDQTADLATRDALDWLEQQGYLAEDAPEEPFLLWVHYFDPHEPYVPPPAIRELLPPEGSEPRQELAAAYDAEIRFADERIGALLDALRSAGRLDDTLLVVVGDHGEGLLDHQDFRGHGPHIYEEAVHVPLLLRWPGVLPAGRRIAAPVSLADLTPTLLELLRAPERPVDPDGQSLVPMLRGDEPGDPERALFFERRAYEPQQIGSLQVRGQKLGLRMGRYKYIEAPEEASFELYDLEADPGEQRNLFAQETGAAAAMARLVSAWRQSAETAQARSDDSAETEEAMRALGYAR